MLAASQISKSFSGVAALQNISVVLMPGELTVVLGPSGSGKTTLLRCISLLELPDSGSIEIDGHTYTHSTARTAGQELYSRVGVVFQGLALWPHLTLRENILLPLRLKRGSTDDPYVAQLIEAFGMGSFVDRFPGQVSGGEKQRAAIVRALVLRPSYLLLDEITSALDVEQVVIVLRELERLKHEGVGILLITHLLGFARRAADHFIFLSDGQIVERGPAVQLENPQSRRLQGFVRHLSQAS